MDEDEYRSAYREVNPLRCVYEKTILTRKLGCSQADIFCLAERYGVACKDSPSQKRCAEVLAVLRQKSMFSLGLKSPQDRLPHSKEMKVQIGGLQGLAAEVGEEVFDQLDVDTLMDKVFKRYPDVQQLPFGDIVQSVVKYQVRRRRKE